MTDQIQEQDVELDDIEEAHDPKNAEAQSVASVDKAAATGPGQAATRTGDKRNSEPMPKTKAGMINAMYTKMSGMNKASLQAMYKGMHEDVEFEEEETAVVSEAQIDVNSELKHLVDNEATLSEEFKEKTAVLFETAVNAKIAEEVERLDEQYKEELAEEVKTMKESMVEKIDSYLNYVVENWMEENKVAIQNGLRTEIAEGFMNSLKNLFTESYIEVPEGKVDLVDDLAGQVEELEEKLNKTTKDAIGLSEEIEVLKRERVIAEAAKGLADTQAEKLAGLCEKIEFEDEVSFAKKVATVKESFFNETKTEAKAIEEAADEGDTEEVAIPSIMEAYVSALRKTQK